MIGSILGSCLGRLEGLNAAYLPDGLGSDLAREIVDRANAENGSSQQFAILVVPEGMQDGISSSQALKYRQGNRLAVVVGRHPDLGSFNQSFQEVLGLNYPEAANNSVALENLARLAVKEILSASAITPDLSWESQFAETIIGECLSRALDIHRELREGTESWNVYWFEHVEFGLLNMVSTLRKIASQGMLLDDFFAEFAYACFGFSRPKIGQSKKPSAKSFVDAYKTHWADQSTVQDSSKYLAHHPDWNANSVHPMESVNWNNFDQTLAATDNHCLAFVKYLSSADALIDGFRALTDEQFINPIQTDEDVNRLIPFDEKGRTISASSAEESRGPFIARSSTSDSGAVMETEILRIRIPRMTGVTAEAVATSSAQIVSTSAQTSWRGNLELDAAGDIWAVGVIERAIGKSKSDKGPRRAKLKVSLSADDTLAGKVSGKATVDIQLIAPESCGLWAIPVRKNGSFGRPAFWNFASETPLSETVAVELDPGAARYRYIVWAHNLEQPPRIETNTLDLLNGRPDIYVGEEVPAALSILEVAGGKFECRSPESGRASHSPIVSAIAKTRATSDPLASETLQSLRGIYETFVSQSHAMTGFTDALGHVAVAGDRTIEVLPTDILAENGLLMSSELSKIWSIVSDFQVPQEILQSDEAREFRLAFTELDLTSRLSARRAGEVGETRVIPSKVSWRSLWELDRPLLERYLSSYADLIEAARRLGDPAALFWATYPLSMSIWQTADASTVSAIMISPLHPIRLAWLAGAESTLWNSSLSKDLAGTIEGWNFPLIGPPESEDGRLVAVPIEAGEDQVFLGWTMLVRASIEVPKALVAPERAGKVAVPGSAASGLNATAVAAALRSYRKMNPHVSTMTIDLAAGTETNRLQEVDEAVLSEIHQWTTKSNQPLFGGARIWDSTKRAGEPPKERMARLVQATDDVPLTWARYIPDNATPKACNVRLLQDAGVRVKIGTVIAASRLGVVGSVPLRRFEALGPTTSEQTSVSSPTIREDMGWEPFTRAIRECEGGPASTTLVTTKLFQASIISPTADWTVSGEALMSPSAMAAIVQKASKGNQMLWEWRPPFLESARDVPALERRPFISVARIPQSFKTQIRGLLSRARGTDVDTAQVDRLLSKLGSRGVGLSAMLSMGGTHASGALGFYLVFAMMERLEQGDGNTFIMPIDACEAFLKALTGGGRHSDTTRRADLLVMRLSGDSITLAPIEIKFYGLDSDLPSGNLPSESDAALKEPLEQVRTTTRLLDDIAAAWARIRTSEDSADRTLWSNGLTTLTEAAVRLQPGKSGTPEGMAKSLSSLAEGKTEIRVGQPIIAYFKHEATTLEGHEYRVAKSGQIDEEGQNAFGLLTANSAAAFNAIDASDSELLDEWGSLVDWSLKEARAIAVQSGHEAEKDGHDSGERVEPPHYTPDSENSNNPQVPQEPNLPINSSSDEEADSTDDIRRSGKTDGNVTPAVAAAFDNGIRSPGVRFPVGRVLGATSEKMAEFWPGNTDLNQMNVGIVGDLGTGKTQLTLALIYQLRKQAEITQETPLSMLVFDYKKDFQEEEFLASVGGHVLNINNIPLNFFQLPGEYTALAANQRANEFIDVLDKIYGGIGPVQRDRLSMAIMDLYRENKKLAPTIGRVLDKYLENDDKPDAVTAILRKFVNAEVFNEDRTHVKSFGELINNKVLVVALNEFGTDDDGKNALVVMFLNLYYDYMLKSKKWPFSGESPQLRRLNSFLLVDEAVNIMKYKFPVLMNLLLQGRQFGFGVILASQYLSHFKKDQENYGEPLLTWFLHKVKTMSPKDLQLVGLGEHAAVLAQRASSLGKHQSIYRSLGFNGQLIEDVPFYKLVQKP